MSGLYNQKHIRNLFTASVSEAESAIYAEGEWCCVLETRAMYYYDKNSSATRDGITVLNTGGAGRLLIMPTGSIERHLVKTSNYTVLNSDPSTIYCDTTSGAFTLTLPATPLEGAIFSIINIGTGEDILTVSRNGKTINRLAEDMEFEKPWAFKLQYTTAYGWLILP